MVARHVNEFTSIGDHNWTDNLGNLFVGREGQSIESFVEELNAPFAPPITTADLIEYAADKRWRVETGGITLGDMPIATDEVSQFKILGAYVAASRNPAWSTMWDSALLIDAPTMLIIGDAVQEHINESFRVRGEVVAAIEASTITTTDEIDAFAWPK